MRFSFDECTVINDLIEEESNNLLSQEEIIEKVNSIKESAEDVELIDLCKSIVTKILTMNEEKFNTFISNLPVETLSNY